MTSTMVRTYKNTTAFRKDAARLAQQGYQVVSTFQEPSKNKPLRNLLKAPVGGTMLWGSSIKGGKIVVTYQSCTQVAVATTGRTALASSAPPAVGTLSPWAMLPVQPAPRGLFARYLGLMVWCGVVLALLGVTALALTGMPF